MRKKADCLIYLLTILFAGICAYIAWFALQYFERMEYLDVVLAKGEKIFLMAAGVCFTVALCVAFFWLERMAAEKLTSEKKRVLEILFVAGSLGILLLGQLVLIKAIAQSTFMFDSGRLYDEAVHMLESHTVDGSAMDGYLAIYPNNIPATILFYWILSAGAAFGLGEPQFMTLLQVGNALCMDGAVLLTYFILRGFVDRKCARMFFLLCLINPMTYIWGGFVYTTTYCMPFLMGALLLFLSLLRENRGIFRIWKGILLGGILAVGLRLRATLIITLLACGIYLFFERLSVFSFRTEREGKTWKLKKYGSFLAFLFSLCMFFSALRAIENSYVKFDTTDTAFPVESWLAMGLEGNGGFNGRDYYDTRNASTAQEKKKINRQKLCERLERLGVDGWLALAGEKMTFLWEDGTDTYRANLDQYVTHNGFHTYLMEDNADFLALLMQIMRAFCFLFAAIGAFVWLFRNKKRERTELLTPVHLLQLNFIGGIFFHILWEDGELYSLSFTFLLFALAAWGITECEKGIEEVRERKPALGYLSMGGTLILALFSVGIFVGMGSHAIDFTETPIWRESFVIKQVTYSSVVQEALTEGNVLTQTFTTNQPFNMLAVRTSGAVAVEADSEYHVTLVDKTGRMLLELFFPGNTAYPMDYVYFPLDGVEEPIIFNDYILTITCIRGTPEGSIGFLRYDTGNHDAYLGGELYENGVPEEKADLDFNVFYKYESPYMEQRDFRLLRGSLLAGMGLITAGMAFLSGYKPGKKKHREFI